uniref:BrnT family toxin n=1 Tax=Candidatus Electronema sp. TaxID=2698783 RepID=UPI0040562387
MKFEWDENKNAVNIRKHKIDFEDIPELFQQPMLIDYDDRQNYGEERWIGIGLLHNMAVAVVFTERGENTIRIISARKATKEERRRYDERILKD